MTEADWTNAEDPRAMLAWLREQKKLSDRKARLFACACCRGVWHLLADERSRYAVEVAERFADGKATAGELLAAREAAYTAVDACLHYTPAWEDQAIAACGSAAEEAEEAAWEAVLYGWEGEDLEQTGSKQARLLRDLFGPLPFREVRIDPAFLACNGGIVRRLAEASYDNRLLPSGELDQAHLSVLADALEEAGSTDAQLLRHLRSDGPHYRGCFAVDAILGRS
jgi:hypothetical protein